jgi:hypothetical protein
VNIFKEELVERYKITKKEYEEGHFIHFMNNRKLTKIAMKMIGGIIKNHFTGYKRANTLFGNNKDLFLSKYGRQDFVANYEYKNWCWGFVTSSGVKFLALTGLQGTAYEYFGDPKFQDLKEIKQFWEEILK